jgi:hypothetical protein
MQTTTSHHLIIGWATSLETEVVAITLTQDSEMVITPWGPYRTGMPIYQDEI